MKIVVLEDDANQTRQINDYLLQYQQVHAGFQYAVKTYSSGRRLLEEYRPDTDLLLLDIQLPDMLGIDVARQIRQNDPRVMIIFVTNLAQYAIDGYSVNAFDYVLKPLNSFSFSKKLERAMRVLSHDENMLKLEISVAAQSAKIQGDAVMLAKLAIGTASCGVLEEESFGGVLLRDDVHHTSDGITSVECRRGSLHNFNLLDIVWVNEPKVVLTTIVTMNALTVNEDEDVVVAQTIHLHLTAHVALVESKRRGQSREDVCHRTTREVLQHLSADNFRLNRRILQQVLSASTRHDHLLQGIPLHDVLR